jgi:hypothetical protein
LACSHSLVEEIARAGFGERKKEIETCKDLYSIKQLITMNDSINLFIVAW